VLLGGRSRRGLGGPIHERGQPPAIEAAGPRLPPWGSSPCNPRPTAFRPVDVVSLNMVRPTVWQACFRGTCYTALACARRPSDRPNATSPVGMLRGLGRSPATPAIRVLCPLESSPAVGATVLDRNPGAPIRGEAGHHDGRGSTVGTVSCAHRQVPRKPRDPTERICHRCAASCNPSGYL
jgi:hypothetical protein